MGNGQTLLPNLEQQSNNNDAVNASDTTLLSTAASINASELVDYDPNPPMLQNGGIPSSSRYYQQQQQQQQQYYPRTNSGSSRYTTSLPNESPSRRYNGGGGFNSGVIYGGVGRTTTDARSYVSGVGGGGNTTTRGGEDDIMSPYYRYDYQGSPIPFSDHSTDGESAISDAYKSLMKRDYCAMRNGGGGGGGGGGYSSYSVSSTPSRVFNNSGNNRYSSPVEGKDVPYTSALDINLDYTVHVGKLAIYLKQIRFNLNRIEEFVLDGSSRLRGKVKCCLLNPNKSQKSTSNIFETVRRNKRFIYADLDENFVFYLFPKNELSSMTLSFKVIICKKLFREFTIGENFIKLGNLDLNAEMLPTTVIFGETSLLASSSGGSAGERQATRSLQPVVLPKSEKLEILLSLEYNVPLAKLIVNIDQTTKLDELRYESKREIIFQAELVSPTCECVQRKTTFLRISEDNPGSNKPFEFDLPQEDLLLNTLMLSASYSATRWLQQEKIGWIAFGRNCSGQVEAEHWDMMISQSSLNEPAVQWHCLCECPDVNKSHTLLTRVFK